MPGYTHDDRRFEIRTPPGKDVILFESLCGGEGLSKKAGATG